MKSGASYRKVMDKRNILISNDDGIDAPGLQSLASELKTFANVYVSAPHKQQSAVGHSITIFYPLRASEHFVNGNFFGWAVEGTPADAVKAGVLFFFKDIKFDLVVSGINHGANTAINIIYSGTVSAATEGSLCGIPAVAVSLTTFEKVDFDSAAKIASNIIKDLLSGEKIKLTPKTLLNINIPNVKPEELKGILITKQGKSYWEDDLEVRSDPNGRDYYWLTGHMVLIDESMEYDIKAIKENYVSITPLQYDLTDYDSYEEMKKFEWKI